MDSKKLPSRLKHKTLINNLTINVIIIICSLVGTIFSCTKFDAGKVTQVCFVLMIFLLAMVVFLYIQNAIYEYHNVKLEFESEKQKLELINSIPHLMIFTKREDHFVIEENGDGILDWTFHIIKETEEPLPYLYFPVLFERISLSDNRDEVFVDILEVKYNGEKCSASYNLNSISQSVSGGVPTETGEISVPVLLKRGRKEFDLFIRIRIRKLFSKYLEKEFVVADIPYITKHFLLSIEINNEKYQIDLPSNFFEAHEKTSISALDSGEIGRQIGNCKIKSNSITWETDYPKLGYSYRLFFKVKEIRKKDL